MVIYNESENGQPDPVGVWFACGIFCENSWKIPVGGKGVRPGKGGKFYLRSGNFAGVRSDWNCETRDHPLISAHGWAELHYESGRYVWRMYGDNNNEVSGSPFRIVLTVELQPGTKCPLQGD